MHTITWSVFGSTDPWKITLEFSQSNDNEIWTPIASGVDIKSVEWKVPDSFQTIYLRATVVDSSNPEKIAFVLQQVEIIELPNTNSQNVLIFSSFSLLLVLGSSLLMFIVRASPKKLGNRWN